MHVGRFGSTAMQSCALLLSGVAAAEDFAAPDAPENIAELGANIQRTMTLLATSTPQKRNHVRILFYGQSVTAGPWSYAVAEDLHKAFPCADIEVENRAIGGYQAESLVNTAEADLYPYYPDLMIFHVYGGIGGELEQIIQRTRQRTTAEILIRTPHLRWPRALARDGSQDDPEVKGVNSEDEQQSALIRNLARKYGLELCDVREQLRKYLNGHNQFPKDTLGDQVHPNIFGNFLIQKMVNFSLRYDEKFPKTPWENLARDIPAGFAAVKRCADGSLETEFEGNRVNMINVPPSKEVWMVNFSLRYDEKFPKTPWENLVRDIPAGHAAAKRGADGSLEVEFEGNRVDVIAAASSEAKLGTAKVLIDGKAPSTFPELYYHTRTSKAPQAWWPAITRVGWEKPRVVEKWTVHVLECDAEKNVLKFEVEGSVTGKDGQGDHSRKFVSNSGRVVIDPGMWRICYTLRYKKIPLPPDFVVTWEVKPLFVDTYQAPRVENPAREYYATLAQGLANCKHSLKLVPNGDGALPIATIRVYRPPLAVEPPPAAAPAAAPAH